MFSRVRRASGGVGWVGGVGEVITFVGTFTHIPYYMFSTARRTLLCRFEPDQKRMSSDTFGSRLSTCYCHKRSACWPTVFKSRATSGKSTARTHARCGFRRPLPRLVMFDLKHQHRLLLLLLLLLHWHVCKNHASCNNMTFGFCSLLITHANTKLTVMIQKQTQKRLRHNNDRKSQKRQKNWKSTRGVAPTKNGIVLVVTVTGRGPHPIYCF